MTQDVATRAGQYDVATVGAYEVPIWAKNDWLHELGSYADGDAGFDKADLLKPMVQSLSGEDGKLYGLPFYGESSFLMYRKDIFASEGHHDARATRPGSRSPTSPRRSTARQPGMKGICLRGLPGLGRAVRRR